MTWVGHWHGYGPWTGTREQYGHEWLRRPGASVGDEQTRAFLSQTMPPMMTGHWLLRRAQTAADRTWTGVQDAVDWLNRVYAENPPFTRDDGGRAYVDLDVKVRYALDVLPRGVDVSWVYYVKSSNLVSFSVVCCPNPHHRGVPCPLSPH